MTQYESVIYVVHEIISGKPLTAFSPESCDEYDNPWPSQNFQLIKVTVVNR